MSQTSSLFADTPILLGVTRWGGRVHRCEDGSLWSPCGENIRHRFTKAPIETNAPLCEKCFTADERSTVTVAEMERS